MLHRMTVKTKILYGFVIATGILVLSPFLISLADLTLLGGLHSRFSALFDPQASASELPPQFSITLDGVHASFKRGSADYDQFLDLFHWCRSAEASIAAGPRPPFRSAVYCGELTIPYGGWPFSFKVLQSNVNDRYFWIAEPHALGTHFPGFHDDGRLMQFLRQRAKRQ